MNPTTLTRNHMSETYIFPSGTGSVDNHVVIEQHDLLKFSLGGHLASLAATCQRTAMTAMAATWLKRVLGARGGHHCRLHFTQATSPAPIYSICMLYMLCVSQNSPVQACGRESLCEALALQVCSFDHGSQIPYVFSHVPGALKSTEFSLFLQKIGFYPRERRYPEDYFS